jgi:hypothetical protein
MLKKSARGSVVSWAKPAHLELYQVSVAAQVGLMRQTEAMNSGKKDAHGFDGDPWAIHINGAIGEQAVAQYLEITWELTVNTYKYFPDLGKNIQVRAASRLTDSLIFRPKDNKDALWVLVVGELQDWYVVGWLEGHKCTKREWFRDPNDRNSPAYFVPQVQLHDMEELKKMIKK